MEKKIPFNVLAGSRIDMERTLNGYNGGKPNLVGAVYIRLTKEVRHKQRAHLQDSDKLFSSLCAAVEKATKRLNIFRFCTSVNRSKYAGCHLEFVME